MVRGLGFAFGLGHYCQQEARDSFGLAEKVSLAMLSLSKRLRRSSGGDEAEDL